MIHPLTDLQVRVLERLADGRNLAEIARELHLSRGTVKRQAAHIRAVLGVPNRVAAVAEFVRQEVGA